MNEADKLRKAIDAAARSGMAIRTILGIIEQVYDIKFRSYVWRMSR